MGMQTIVSYMLEFPTGLPSYYERAHRSRTPLREHFNRRLDSVKEILGEPSLETNLDWFAGAKIAAVWNRKDRTLALIEERNDAILFWGVSDTQLRTLREAARSRNDRIRDPEFPRTVDELFQNAARPGFERQIHYRLLVDELLADPEKSRPLVDAKLRDSDGEIRCEAASVVLNLYSGPRTSDQKVAILSYCFVRAFLPATPRYTSTGGR